MVVIVVWLCRICLSVCVIVVTNATVKRKYMVPVIRSSINETGEEPVVSC